MIHDLGMFDMLITFTISSWAFILGIAIIIITVMLIFKWIPLWINRWKEVNDDDWRSK